MITVFKVTIRQTMNVDAESVPQDKTVTSYFQNMEDAVKMVSRFKDWQNDPGRIVERVTIKTIYVMEHA